MNFLTEDSFTLLFGIVSTFVLVTFFATLTRSSNRVLKLRKIAADFGFEFIDTAPEKEIFPLQEQVPLFSRGKKRFVRNILQGKSNAGSIKFFDFEYWITINGKGRTIQTIFWMEHPAELLPRFSIRQQTWLDNFVKPDHVTGPFCISGDGAGWIRTRLDRHASEYLETFPGINVEAFSNHLIIYLEDTRSSENLLKADKETYQSLITLGGFLANLLSSEQSSSE